MRIVSIYIGKLERALGSDSIFGVPVDGLRSRAEPRRGPVFASYFTDGYDSPTESLTVTNISIDNHGVKHSGREPTGVSGPANVKTSTVLRLPP